MQNERILLARVPAGVPVEEDFLRESVEAPRCEAGQLLVRTQYLSVDPYLRGRISGVKSYIEPIRVGTPMESSAVGVVVESRAAGYGAGDVVAGFWHWQRLVAVEASRVYRVDESVAPASAALGVLGMPGMTAYFGLTELCQPKAGETLLVTGAAGAVGSAVGQIGKILGCRVVGVAGTEEKVAYVRSLGFDEVLNYRTAQPYGAALARACPAGIDCFFDNVGGEMTDAAYPLMNPFGRVAVCGQIAHYNDEAGDVGPRPFMNILKKQLRVEGFIVSRWAGRFAEGRMKMGEWVKAGKLRYEETIYEGLENAPKAFLGLFRGENTGKSLVRL